MAKGGRTNLRDLADSVGENSSVKYAPVDGVFRPRVGLKDLAPNPDNPRDTVGDLSDLSTIVEKQLQPATAITREAWLRVNPQHEQTIGDARFVVINGNRRLAAANKFGANGLDIVIRDSLAADTQTILWAAIVENLDRRDFDVLEEARAVKLLCDSLDSQVAAAKRLNKSGAWISQRLALLDLTPELQQKLRDGDLAVREARSLARVPRAEQVAAWQAKTGGGEGVQPNRAPTASRPAQETMRRALKRSSVDPKSLASAVAEEWTPAKVRSLIAALEKHVARD